MLPLRRDIVKLRVDREIWEDVLKNAKIDDKNNNTKVLLSMLKQNQQQNKKIKKLQKKIESINDLNKKIKSEQHQFKKERLTVEKHRKQIEENKIIYEILRKSHKRLESDYETLKTSYNELKNNPIVEEKIIYKEDNTKINKLSEKNDKLHKKLWEKEHIIKELNKDLKVLRSKIETIEEWKRRNFGVVLKVKPKDDDGLKFDFESEFINFSEFNMWLRNQNEFIMNKNIDTPFHILDIGNVLPNID